MEPERWERVEGLFLLAADLEPAAREELLARECAGDDALRAEVERLLAHDTAGDHPLEMVALEEYLASPEKLLGQQLGAYRLVEHIASGGMGIVYRAERTDGLFEREAAVKLIRSERLGPEALRRFDVERRALAGLDHPHIGRLYDGGTTRDGRPYLVMELLQGVPVDRYLEARGASVAERLRLFVKVCRAVHFAHANLVVHCDLKPGNVLVDRTGEPKLLDFGIARILDEGREVRAPEEPRPAFTPAYASPEQVAGGPVTTAIDVYSLGVMLYELLAGVPPFPLAESLGPAASRPSRSERTPTPPSRAKGGDHRSGSTTGVPDRKGRQGRGGSATRRRRLAGDLDAIVLQAMHPEPARRYASAGALADDLERHLAGRPVLAREDTLAYRGLSFVQRNRVVSALAVTAVAALVTGLLLARASERRARLEAERAGLEAASAAGMTHVLTDTFLTSRAALDPERLDEARERLLLHAEHARYEHADDDLLRANLLDGIGRVSTELGLLEQAGDLLREAHAIRAAAHGPESIEVALSLQGLGRWHRARGELDTAREVLEQGLALQREFRSDPRADPATAANDLGTVLRGLGDVERALALQREALELRELHRPDSLPVAESCNNLALLHLDRGEHAEALALLERALELRRASLTIRHPLTLQVLTNLAVPNWQLDRQEAAVGHLEQAAEGFRALGASGREGLARTLANLGVMRVMSGDPDRARGNLEEALELERERLGPEHPSLASMHAKLGELHGTLGSLGEAEAHWERAIELNRSAATGPRALATALYGYGRHLLRSQEPERARPVLSEAVAVLAAGEVDELALGRAHLALSGCLFELALRDEARASFERAVACLEGNPAAASDLEAARTQFASRGWLPAEGAPSER